MRILAFSAAAVLCCLAPALAGSSVSMSIGDLKIDFRDPNLKPKPGPEQQYVTDYLAAVASHDPARYRTLIHPAALSCLSDETGQKLFDQLSMRAIKRNIPGDATIVIVQPTPGVAPPPAPGAMTFYPAQPAKVIAVDYDFSGADLAGKGKGSGQTIVDLLALDDGKLKLLPPCLTKEGGAKFLERLKSQAK